MGQNSIYNLLFRYRISYLEIGPCSDQMVFCPIWHPIGHYMYSQYNLELSAETRTSDMRREQVGANDVSYGMGAGHMGQKQVAWEIISQRLYY